MVSLGGSALTNKSNVTAGGRFVWADVIKGVCIVLVVLVHVTNKQYPAVSGPESVHAFWDVLSRGLNPVRMPLFFLMSGFLAAPSINRPWSKVLQRRVAQPYYLYVVWLVLSGAFYAALAAPVDGMGAASLSGVLRSLAFPSSSLWYLYALGAYFLFAKALAGLPRPASMAIAVSLAVVASMWPLTVQLGVVGNFVFFVIGAYFPRLVEATADRACPSRALIAACLYLGVVGLYVAGADDIAGVRPAAAAVATWGGVTVVAVLARFSWLAKVGQFVGRNTLPVYVLHLPLLALLSHSIALQSDGGWLPYLFATLYPVVTTVALVIASLGLRRFSTMIGFGWLFSMPGDHLRPRK
ncbi:acyltransferase family protein [Arthrobacter sedimenti]|uniref:acyltransferase family protein n=1 Tax=Arthrobacter sedimenti TaxID=2694931 RepID=UPI000B35A760|nr:acyltransferase family protein [Arthrobacter sedimenti]OUM40855.1 hypothetical protein B8W73_10725 [Arthrobacter agilis]